MKQVCLFFLFSAALVSRGNAGPLSVDAVLKSAVRHYPEALVAEQKVLAQEMATISAKGGFDSYLDVEADARLEGPYDGRYTDVKLVKPFAALNSKIYAGHRVSEGEFPVYEGKLDTLDEGENRLGVELSLLRDSLIDPKRLKLRNAQLKTRQARAELGATRLETLRNAYVAYWNWVAKGEIYQIQKDLYDLSLRRAKGLKRKVEKGAIAKIYLDENAQYLAQRKAKTIEGKQELQEAALKLSLFYRNEKGEPIAPPPEALPAKVQEGEKLGKQSLELGLKAAMAESPILKSFDPAIEEKENMAQYGSNLRKPRLDLKYEISKDTGEGRDSLRGREQRVLLNFEIPLQTNLGAGALAESRAQKRSLVFKKRLAREKLQNLVRALALKARAMGATIEAIEREVTLAKRLERAERKKFQTGGGISSW